MRSIVSVSATSRPDNYTASALAIDLELLLPFIFVRALGTSLPQKAPHLHAPAFELVLGLFKAILRR